MAVLNQCDIASALNWNKAGVTRVSGKITTVSRLFAEHSLQNENKHQIMNVHTKWNCFLPFLSSLVNY